MSSAGYSPLRNAGENDPLTALAAESEAAVDRLVASIDWVAHDAAVAALAAQSDAALHHLALLCDAERALHAAGRLALDGDVGRAAAATHGSAAAVEERQPDVVLLGDGHQLLLTPGVEEEGGVGC